MFPRLNLCAVEFMLAAAAKPCEDKGGVELVSRGFAAVSHERE